MNPGLTVVFLAPLLRKALTPLMALGLGAAVPPLAWAQSGGGTPVVQPLPSRESLQLSAALSRLGRNPRDVDALVDAGNAASAMGDFEAAIGFFKRGEQISANDPRLLGGLARALVQHGEPVDAIPLFARAEQAGAKPADIAGDRGLGYDLVGDPATAQRYYLAALAAGNDDEITRRLAVSYAISGDEKAMERTILPLLRRQDKAAWRARAFALAILGKNNEAIKITRTLLPKRLAESISPYLEYMPRLTASQQASAANLGVFPRASQIGRDGTAIAAYTPGQASTPGTVSAGKSQAQAGKPAAPREPSRQEQRRARREARDKTKRVAPPEPRPSRQAGSVEEPVFAAAAALAAPPVAAIMSNEAQQGGKAGDQALEPAASPGFDLARLPAAPAAAAPAPEVPTYVPAAAAPPPAPPPSFASAFGDLGRPEAGAAPASGAVDVRSIEPARPAPPKPATPPPPSHPSRIWVQLGIGQKLPALAFDWKRFAKSAPDLFAGRKPYSAKLNQTNRLLTGPFASQKEATAFLASLRQAGIAGPYIWTSPAGEVVDALPH